MPTVIVAGLKLLPMVGSGAYGKKTFYSTDAAAGVYFQSFAKIPSDL